MDHLVVRPSKCATHCELVRQAHAHHNVCVALAPDDIGLHVFAPAVLADHDYFWLCTPPLSFEAFARTNTALGWKDAYRKFQCGRVAVRDGAVSFDLCTPMSYIEGNRLEERHVHLMHTQSKKVYTVMLRPGEQTDARGSRVTVTPRDPGSVYTCMAHASILRHGMGMAVVLRTAGSKEHARAHTVDASTTDLTFVLRGRPLSTPVVVLADADHSVTQEIVRLCCDLGFVRLVLCIRPSAASCCLLM